MPGASKNPHPLADGMAIKTVEMRSPIPIAIIKLLLFMSARPRDTTGCSQRYTPIIPGLFTIIRADLHSKCTGFSTGYQQCFACEGSCGRAEARLSSLRANGPRECAPDDRLREAIHGRATKEDGLLRRFAPRNDGTQTTPPHSRDAKRPSCCMNVVPPQERAQGMPDAQGTRSLACSKKHAS